MFFPSIAESQPELDDLYKKYPHKHKVIQFLHAIKKFPFQDARNIAERLGICRCAAQKWSILYSMGGAESLLNPREILSQTEYLDELDYLNPLPPAQNENVRIFNRTVDEIRLIMRGNNSCSEFYGGVGEDVLDEIVKRVTSESFKAFQGNSSVGIEMYIPTLMSPGTVPISLKNSGYFAVSPSRVEINTNGAFIKRIAVSGARLPRFGNYNTGSLKSRVLQLLHEMGHLTIVKTYHTLYFFDRKKNDPPRKPLRMILLDHLLTLDGSNPKRGIDASKATSMSEDNTEKVLTACRTQIDAIRDRN